MDEKKEILNEGQNYEFKLKTTLDTTNTTIKAYIFDEDDPNDTGTEVGSASGDSPNTEISVDLDLKTAGVQAGEKYVAEFWMEPGGSNARLLYPDEGKIFILEIQDRRQFT